MERSLFESVLSDISSETISQITRALSRRTSVVPAAVEHAIAKGVPAVLAVIARQGADPEGALKIMRLLKQAKVDSFPSVDDDTSSYIERGRAVLAVLLDDDTSDFITRVSSLLDIEPDLFKRVLPFIMPVTLRAISRFIGSKALSAGGLASLLTQQLVDIEQRFPAALAVAIRETPKKKGAYSDRLNDQDLGITGSGSASAAVRTSAAGWTAGSLFCGIFLLGGLIWWASDRQDHTTGAAQQTFKGVDESSRAMVGGHKRIPGSAVEMNSDVSLNLPSGLRLAVPAGSVEVALVGYLDQLPADRVAKMTFSLDRLPFESDSVSVPSEAREHLNNLALILKAYPEAQIELVEYENASSDAAVNRSLAKERAKTIARMFVERGVAENRIEAVGHGGAAPIIATATVGGVAKIRGIELRVTTR